MPCDSMRQPRQTVEERRIEVRRAKMAMDKLVAQGKAKVTVDRKTGAVVISGVANSVRSRVNDACVVRHIMTHGSVAARTAIAKAEQLAGRSVDKQAIEAGLHSHDGGATWGTD